MARPSLASVRRPEILDAVCTTMLRVGVANTTLARIADVAGVQPSIIRHYLGNKSEVMRAAVERALENALDVVGSEEQRAADPDELLDRLFDGRLSAPEINQLVDQLIGESYHDDELRDDLGAIYLRFLQSLSAQLPVSVPADQREVTAFSLLCIAHAAQTFEHLGFADNPLPLAREAARLALLRHVDAEESE